MRKFLVAALLLAATPALAQTSNSPAYQLYKEGQYDAAIKTGIAAADGDGFTQAAHAQMAKTRIAGAPCLPCLKQAEDYARKAIAVDATQPEARVYLAATLGYESRLIGILEAREKGYAEESKANLDAAYKLHPEDAYVLAALGGWHIGVVNGGGAMLARMMYGATLDKGLAFYGKAFAAAPQNIVIRFQYALALSTYDRDAYAKQIEAALKFTVNGTPRTAYERFMQGQAKQLLALWDKGDWTAYKALMRKVQGYAD